MALTAAEQVAQDLAEFLAHTERPHDKWLPVQDSGAPRFGLIAGYEVLPHVQRFADAVRKATKVKSIGTYPGHSPSLERALDLFHAVNDNALANAISQFAIATQAKYGVRYVIDRQQIWHRLDPVWRDMEDRGDNTQNHYDHNHISFETTAADVPEPTPEPDPVHEEDDMALPLFGDAPEGRGGGLWMIFGGFRKRVHTTQVWDDYQRLGSKHVGDVLKDSAGKFPVAMFDATIDIEAALAAQIVVTPGENGAIDYKAVGEAVADELYGRLAG